MLCEYIKLTFRGRSRMDLIYWFLLLLPCRHCMCTHMDMYAKMTSKMGVVTKNPPPPGADTGGGLWGL